MVTGLQLLVYSLAVFRLTTMITMESGPGWIFRRLRSLVRRKAPKKTHMDEGIECPWCMSMQIALVFVALEHFFASSPWFQAPVLALALSAVAGLLAKIRSET